MLSLEVVVGEEVRSFAPLCTGLVIFPTFSGARSATPKYRLGGLPIFTSSLAYNKATYASYAYISPIYILSSVTYHHIAEYKLDLSAMPSATI